MFTSLSDKLQLSFEKLKGQIDQQKMQQEVAAKKELMQLEFQMNMQLKQMEVEAQKGKESENLESLKNNLGIDDFNGNFFINLQNPNTNVK